jgi:hydrogenase expression/formation protein HypC
MCLAVPAKIVSLDAESALADLHGNRVQISTALVPEAKLGDWVLLHAGFAIKILDCEEAAETFRVLEDLSYRIAEGEAHAAPRG